MVEQKYLDKVRELFDSESSFLSIDTEMYEHDHDYLTEIGWTFVTADTVSYRHIIIEENRKYRNGKYVPDNRDEFSFGESTITPFDEALDEFRSILSQADVIVGHDLKADFRQIYEKMSIRFDCQAGDTYKVYMKEESSEYKLIKVVDTLKIVGMKLSKAFKLAGLKSDLCFHNAGNDAAATMMLMFNSINAPPFW